MSTVPVHFNSAHRTVSVSLHKPERVLFLDYDGTIAPFVANRSLAHPYPRVPELLDEIVERCDTRVVIVSGRPVKDMTALLQMNTQPEIWGCHGLERLLPDGQYSCVRLSPESELALSEAVRRLQDFGLDEQVEKKYGCVAVHWRGTSLKREEEVRALAYTTLSKYSGRNGLFICEFDGGLELRHRVCAKKQIVQTVLSELNSDAAVAYLGDDVTDEEAFRLLNGRGLTILIRPTYRFTAAQFWLQPPQELLAFLAQWIEGCNEGRR